jgi:hypothetical protein
VRAIVVVALSWVLLAAGSAPADTRESETTADPEITRIQGRLIEGRRSPVVGASVVVRNEGDGGLLFLTSTGAAGGMRVVDIPDGTYRVVFRKDGYETIEKSGVEVRMPLRAVLEVPMRADGGEPSGARDDTAPAQGDPVDVHGRVRDATGHGVADVRIRFVRGDGSVDPRLVRTDSTGAFVTEELPAGRWNVEVLGVGYLPIRAPVSIDRPSDVTVRLVEQPADFVASPLDLMPPEKPVAPPELEGAPSSEDIEG